MGRDECEWKEAEREWNARGKRNRTRVGRDERAWGIASGHSDSVGHGTSGCYKPELTAMSLLVSQYTEHVAMRVEGAVTASGTFVHSFLASFISLHSL